MPAEFARGGEGVEVEVEVDMMSKVLGDCIRIPCRSLMIGLAEGGQEPAVPANKDSSPGVCWISRSRINRDPRGQRLGMAVDLGG